jgi:flagellar basal-body rod protein FlgB
MLFCFGSKKGVQIDTTKGHCYYLNMMLLDDSFDVLRRGLSASSYRHDQIANNIANNSTPGYRRHDVDFQGLFEANMKSEMPANKTHDGHMSFHNESFDRAMFTTQPDDTDVKSDGNNVDLDKEVVNMSNNSVYYNTLATILSKKFRALRTAISERVS